MCCRGSFRSPRNGALWYCSAVFVLRFWPDCEEPSPPKRSRSRSSLSKRPHRFVRSTTELPTCFAPLIYRLPTMSICPSHLPTDMELELDSHLLFVLLTRSKLPLRRRGEFPPRWIRRSHFRIQGLPPAAGATRSRYLVLADGGVYDNMADQWAQGFVTRSHRYPQVSEPDRVPEELIVVNASAAIGWTPFKRGYVPIVGEGAALLRDKSILYNATTAPRRHDLVTSFERAIQTGQRLSGAPVNIPQSPFRVARPYARTG